jgi:hypothetical protein
MSATSIPNPCRITNIDPNDVMILPYDANLRRMKFSETTGAVAASLIPSSSYIVTMNPIWRVRSRRWKW